MCALRDEYLARHRDSLVPLADAIARDLRELLEDEPHIDRISARAKSPDRFMAKAAKMEGGVRKYASPLDHIQDQVGARVVCFYISDVENVVDVVLRNYRPIEQRVVVPDSESEFGYFGRHMILIVPETLTVHGAPRFFEFQVKTLFQHAWSEANHDLGYKPETSLSSTTRRRIAFASAQAWGADQIFNELQRELTAERPAEQQG